MNTIVEAWSYVAVYKPLQKRICHIETERKILSAHWSNIQHIQMCSIIVVLLKTHIHTYIYYLLHSYLGMYMRCISEMKELRYKHINTQMSKSGFQLFLRPLHKEEPTPKTLRFRGAESFLGNPQEGNCRVLMYLLCVCVSRFHPTESY